MHHIQRLRSHLPLHVNCQSQLTDIIAYISRPHSTHRGRALNSHSTKKNCQQITQFISKKLPIYALSKWRILENRWKIIQEKVQNCICDRLTVTKQLFWSTKSYQQNAQFITRIRLICCSELVGFTQFYESKYNPRQSSSVLTTVKQTILCQN